MEQPSKDPSPEDIESQIEKLIEQEEILYRRYIELYGMPEPDSEVDREEYAVHEQARVGYLAPEYRVKAKEELEQFVQWLKDAIAEKEK